MSADSFKLWKVLWFIIVKFDYLYGITYLHIPKISPATFFKSLRTKEPWKCSQKDADGMYILAKFSYI
jgi:hypothetical protein